MSYKRNVIGFVAATLLPTLGALQLVGTADLTSAQYWLAIAAVFVSSFSAAGIYALTQLNSDAGNPPIEPPKPAESKPPVV
jgi:hypothetical protein